MLDELADADDILLCIGELFGGSSAVSSAAGVSAAVSVLAAGLGSGGCGSVGGAGSQLRQSTAHTAAGQAAFS